MKKRINKTVDFDLTQVNGNAFAIMSAFTRQAEREGWSSHEINLVLDEAKSNNYNHLLATISAHCKPHQD